MTVTTRHREYEDEASQWELVRDAVKGSKAIKGRGGSSVEGVTGGLWTTSGTRYLPAPNADDNSSENRGRYVAYKQRANFVNFTGHTKDGMLGMVFRKDMEYKLPPSIDYMDENANGGGMSLEQFTRDTTGDVLETGRYGILVDYPSAPEGATKETIERLGIKATLVPYVAESIINWRTEIIGSTKMLTMVVLCEEHEDITDDGFEVELEKQYRVCTLEMDESGNLIYVQRLYDDDGKPEAFEYYYDEEIGDTVGTYEIYPKMANGDHWNIIPFVFIGSQNNDETVDQPPLYDIAEVNVAHYRNSADYEESCFMVGQPTPVLTGLSQPWVDDVLKGTVTLGSRAAIALPAEASAMLLQADPNQMPSKGMEEKEKQIVMIGARLIQDNGGTETAEAAKIRYAGQNSKLGSLVGNVSEGTERALLYAAMFMDTGIATSGEVDEEALDVTLNTEFYAASVDAQLLAQLIILGDRGEIAGTDIRNVLRKGGVIERDDETILAEAEATSPIGVA